MDRFNKLVSLYFFLAYFNEKLDQKKSEEYYIKANQEIFSIQNSKNFFHDEALSAKFTAQNCFGNTDGTLDFYDDERKVSFKLYHEIGSCASMLNYFRENNNSYFLRFLTSVKENNDVLHKSTKKKYENFLSIKLK